MEYRKLGTTDLDVSVICLGTMTWGEQNTQDEGFEQMDYALAQGVNFWDTAELYSVPPRAETYGATETIIGNWFASRGQRDKVILASKVAGPGPAHIRGGNGLKPGGIRQALEGSLKRLQTDYIDLYQVHWPDRKTNFFGKLGYQHDENDDSVPIRETLNELEDLVKEGKIRHIGISNETPYGTLQYLRFAAAEGKPRVMSIQNPYNLLNRSFEVGLAEMAIKEKVGLLAYSPLAFGMLSGKYLNGARPENARLTMFHQFQRYWKPNAERATERYVKLAKDHGLDPSQMALAYINTRPFVTANIIGATTMEQLKDDIASMYVKLSDEVLEAIEDIHHDIPNPAP